MPPVVKKPRKGVSKTSKKARPKASPEDLDPPTLEIGKSEVLEEGEWDDENGEIGYQMALNGKAKEGHPEATEHEDQQDAEEDDDFHRSSMEGPAPTPLLDESTFGESRPTDLETALEMALDRLENMPMVDFLQNISKQADVHAQALMSAKEIANDFVANAADLAQAMQLILQYDQLMLAKLNFTTAYDFGIKPKTDEETRAIMVDRAQHMLELGQMQYNISHQISEAARPLIDYRFEACDDFNAVQAKISAIKESEEARKQAHLAKIAGKEEQSKAVVEREAMTRLDSAVGAKSTEENPSAFGVKGEANTEGSK